MNEINLFKALADENRLEILTLLKDSKMSAGDISSKFDLTQATMSYHLSILKESGLVRIEKISKNTIYELNTSVFEDIITWIYKFRRNSNENKFR